jgi:hypothetical protein
LMLAMITISQPANATQPAQRLPVADMFTLPSEASFSRR